MHRRIQYLLPLVLIAMVGCRQGEPRQGGGEGTSPKQTPAEFEEIKGEERAVLVAPPAVPPRITRNHATKVIIELEVREEVMRLADGVEFTFWTFGSTVPGPLIRVREGDEIEFHLHNHPDSKNPHNIDLHAVNGPGGGAEASFTAPGHTSVFSFRVLNPGLYVYHCATPPVAMHVGNGMYGMILVEPREGMSEVDREYYLMQGEFYTAGRFGERGLQPFSMAKAIDENADYVVFNGSVGALMDQNALKADVGQTVRMFVGNGGPNLLSSFHIIGEIFDRVHLEAGSRVSNNVQTTLIPAGGAALVEFKVNTAGTYVIVDHSLTRAFNKGAIGQLQVGGEENKAVFSGKQRDLVYLPEGSGLRVGEGPKPSVPPAKTLAERIDRGRTVYQQNCQACHQANGEGVPRAFPPLAKADYLLEDVPRAIRIVTGGMSEPIVVNGERYEGLMPAWPLSDEDVANVMTFILKTWGNNGPEVTPEMVAKNRAPVDVNQQK